MGTLEWVTLAVIIGLVLLLAHVYNGRYAQDRQGGTVWALLGLGLAGALFVVGLVARWEWPPIIATVLFILAVNVVVTALSNRTERRNKQHDARVSDDTPAQRRAGRGSRGPAPAARAPSPRDHRAEPVGAATWLADRDTRALPARPPRPVTAAASGQVFPHRLHGEALRLRDEDPELSAALVAVYAGLMEERPVLVTELDTIVGVARRLGVEDRVILHIRGLY